MKENPANQAVYIGRINKTLDYIEVNIGKPMTLEELAGVASFSRFHFSRIFHSMVGETPFQFIQRVRLEKAATLLLGPGRRTVSDVALQCGFPEIAVFSRNFRRQFGMSPSQYRLKKHEHSSISQLLRKGSQTGSQSGPYFCPQHQTIKWRTNMKQNKNVEVRELPAMTVAYIRHTGPYKGDEKLFEGLWNRLFAWAGARGLIGGPDFRSLVIYHDDPNITNEDKLRMSVCITVPADTRVEGEIGKMELESARYVVARFEVAADEFQLAWDWLYGQWFPTSGYQPDDKPCFEMYPEEPRDGKFIVDICVPVKVL